MTLFFLLCAEDEVQPECGRANVSGDWRKSGALGLLAAAATFVWLWWRLEWNENASVSRAGGST